MEPDGKGKQGRDGWDLAMCTAYYKGRKARRTVTQGAASAADAAGMELEAMFGLGAEASNTQSAAKFDEDECFDFREGR